MTMARPIFRGGSAPGYRPSSPMKTGETCLTSAPNRIKKPRNQWESPFPNTLLSASDNGQDSTENQQDF